MSARTHRAKRNRTRVRVCVSPQHARVSTQKHTITSTALIYTPAACTHQHQNNKTPAPGQSHTSTIYARTLVGCVRVCMSAAQLVTLVACVYGSLSHSARWGHCVLCVNVSGIYLLGGGIKVSGGGGSVRACVLVVAMVCVCACAGGDDACARVRAFVCSCWR